MDAMMVVPDPINKSAEGLGFAAVAEDDGAVALETPVSVKRRSLSL